MQYPNPNPTLPSFLFVLLLLLTSFPQTSQALNPLNPLKINTTIGRIYGLINGSTPDVVQFLGIPFAEPPTGSRRWLPPVPKNSVVNDSTVVIDATKFSVSCPQVELAVRSVYKVDTRNFLIGGPTGEDCLTLNVWAPLSAVVGTGNDGNGNGKGKEEGEGRGLPVLVWIYGGGFITGGGETGYQIPSRWIQRMKGHIVVGIKRMMNLPSYRLNIFGFLNAAGLNQSDLNIGLLDQRLALEWIQLNIASFGGDPSRITIWGQSAGAMSVDYYNFAYPDDPIVAGLIMDSGTALLPIGSDDPTHSNFSFVARNLGCGSSSSSSSSSSSAEEELECMRNVSSVDIEAFIKAYADNGTVPSISFLPANDERIKFENVTERALAGNYSKVPAIIGTNANEGISLVGWNPDGNNVTLGNATTLNAFLCPADQTTKNRYASSAQTYRYLYAGNFSNISSRAWEGAYHSSELPLLFGTSSIANGESTDFEIELGMKMQDLWGRFIADPIEGLVGSGWSGC